MNKGLKIFLIILGEIALIASTLFIGSIIFKTPETDCKIQEKEGQVDKKEDIEENKENLNYEDNTLATIQKVYEEAYDLLYEEFIPSNCEKEIDYYGKKIKVHVINKDKLSTYFTEKRLDFVLNNYSNAGIEDEFYYTYDLEEDDYQKSFDPGTIFGETDGGQRTLEIITSNDEYILARGEITKTQFGQFGGEYIIFKKEAGNWKIDSYE